MRFISPPLDELDLNKTEAQLVDLFDQKLKEKWEIFIYPHLNGERPAIVLLHPKWGIAFFEIVYLNVNDSWCDQVVRNEEYSFKTLNSFNPIPNLWHLHDSVSKLYCPRLKTSAARSLISCGIIFTKNEQDELDRRIGKIFRQEYKNEKKFTYVGCDELEKGNIDLIFPKHKGVKSVINEDYYDDLRGWLLEPQLLKSDRKTIVLDPKQEKIVRDDITTKSKSRRVKGPAGSGKTLVLACRIARLMAEGKDVLCITYNITLIHFVRRLIYRALEYRENGSLIKNKGHIEIHNFHSYMRKLSRDIGRLNSYKSIWKDVLRNDSNKKESAKEELLSKELPALILKMIKSAKNDGQEFPTYDAIIADEAQDFRPLWWNVLKECADQKTEMMLFADSSQDIYESSSLWTENRMAESGFTGEWVKFTDSYRLPNDFIKYVCSFSEKFIPDVIRDLPNVPKEDSNLSFKNIIKETKMKWIQFDGSFNGPIASEKSLEKCAAICAFEITEILKENKDSRVSDIVFLSPRINFGLKVVTALLEKYKYYTTHTFSEDQKTVAELKKKFFQSRKEPALIRATTIHSFKGYESTDLVIFIDDNPHQPINVMMYIALTRLLKNEEEGSRITVICANKNYEEYGKTWPNFDKIGS